MTVEIQINGTALVPQPRDANWRPTPNGPKLDGTEDVSSYDTLVLRAPPARGGTANFNWGDFENQVLTSIQAFPKGQTMKTGTATTYNSGVVSAPITVSAQPGDILQTEMIVRVVT